MDATKLEPVDERQGYLLLWVGVLLAPIAWLIQFEIRYSLVAAVCENNTRIPLYIISGVFFAIMALGGVLSWRNWVREGKASPTDKRGDPHERNLFLSLLGILTSGLFALILVAQTIASVMVNPCWK
jgi:hypothetical protein